MTHTSKVELETSYRMSWKNIVLLLCVGLILGPFMVHEALTNDQRLLINGLIELSVAQARVFFWVLAAIMFATGVLALMGLVQRLRNTDRLVITAEGLSMPGPVWSPAQRFYPFAAIESMQVVTVYKTRMLQGKSQQGRFAIASQNLASPAKFEKVVALLLRLRTAQRLP